MTDEWSNWEIQAEIERIHTLLETMVTRNQSNLKEYIVTQDLRLHALEDRVMKLEDSG